MDVFGRPHYVSIDFEESPYHVYKRLSSRHIGSFLLESLSGPGVMAEASIVGFEPAMVVRGYADRIETEAEDDVHTIRTEEPFLELRRMMASTDDMSHRYVGGAVGVVNYDAIRLTERIQQSHDTPQPLFEFGMYNDGILFDNRTNKAHYFWYDEDRSHIVREESIPQEPFSASKPVSVTDAQHFAEMVERARRYIYDGDIFQVVLSRRFTFEASGDSVELYERLRRLNPSPYMFHIKHGDRIAIGASPEMLVRVSGDRVETFPIAGTRRISADSAENSRLAQELLHDQKELAEHTMLVDLGRNDIGRVCRYGTVRPVSLMQVKRFSHVQHMVTHVAGTMDPTYDMFDAFRAVFPAGTVSGAPKVRAMEIIDELEPDARGPYAGAAGYFSYNGCCDFAIAIRSVFIEGQSGYVQSGAGVVYDSMARREFDETEEKASAMLQALQETPP